MIQRRLITYYTNKEFGKIDGCVPRLKAVQ
jgi:hypothetical protein